MYKKLIYLISFMLMLGIGSVSAECMYVTDDMQCTDISGICSRGLLVLSNNDVQRTAGYVRFENIPLGSIVHNLSCVHGSHSDNGSYVSLILLSQNPHFDGMVWATSPCRYGCGGTTLGTIFINSTATAPEPLWDGLNLIISGNQTFAFDPVFDNITGNHSAIQSNFYDADGCEICYSATSCTVDSECNDTENVFCQQAEDYCLMNNMEINVTDFDIVNQDVTIEHDNWIGSELYDNTTNMTLDRNTNWGEFADGYQNANTRVSTWFDGFARFGNIFGYQANAFDNANDKIGQSNIDYAIMTEGSLNLTINVYFEHNPTQGIDNVSVSVNNVDVAGFNRTDYTNVNGTITFYNMGAGEYEIDLSRAGLRSVNTFTFMYFENEEKDVYMFLDYNDVWFNMTTYDAGTYAVVGTVALEFADYGTTILNYPNGGWTPITTRYSNSTGNFIGSVTDTPECFAIGFKKSGYFAPKTSGVHINVKEICLNELWYDNDTQRYDVPYFDYYLIPEGDELNLTLIIRSGDSYEKLAGATINVVAPSGALYSDTSDANGEMEIIDDTGCYNFAVSLEDYLSVNLNGCFWNEGTYSHTIYLIQDVEDENATVGNYNITGYTLNTSAILPYTNLAMSCIIEAYGGQDMFYHSDVTISNSTGQYLFQDVRENSVCTIIASKNGYTDGSNTIEVDGNEVVNVTLSYTGLTYKIEGYVTDCATGDVLTNARIDWADCLSGFDTCTNLRSTAFSDDDGYYKITGIDEGFNKFIFEASEHETIFKFQNTLSNSQLDVCLPTELARYWIRGIVLNTTLVDDYTEIFASVESVVRVFNEGDNAVLNLMETNIDGKFAFYLKEGRYTLTAESGTAKGEETFLVNHNFAENEARIVLESDILTERIETESDFIDTLYAIVPSIIVIFIFLMLIAGLKNVNR